ncbi:MAG: hypothetical protein ACKO3R_01760 [bacterium]
MNININIQIIQKIKGLKYYKDDLLTRLFAGDRVLGSSERAAVHFLDANSDGDFNDSVDITARTTFGNQIDTIYNSVFDTSGNLKLNTSGNLSSVYVNNDGSFRSGSIDINNDGSKDAIDHQILQTTMNIANKVQEDVKTNLTNAIKSGTVPILGTQFNLADMSLLQEATKNNKVNYVYTEAFWRENGHESKNLFSSKNDFTNFFNDLFDRDFNLNQVKEVLLMADTLASKLPVTPPATTPTLAQKQDCVRRLELYSSMMKNCDSSSKDLLSFDTLATAANTSILPLANLTSSQIKAYDPATSNIYGSLGDGLKMNNLLSVVAGDKTDPDSSTKQRYLVSAINERKLPISGKTLDLSTLSTGSNFATAYTNLNILFDAVGDNVKTTKLQLDAMAVDPKYAGLFVNMTKTGTEPVLINQLKAKVTNGSCNLSQAQKLIELASELQRNRKSSGDSTLDQQNFEKKLQLYSTIFLDSNSSVNVRDIASFDKFLSASPAPPAIAGSPTAAELSLAASGLGFIDSTLLSTYAPGRPLFNTTTTNGQNLQNLWNVFLGNNTDPDSSTKQRYLISSINEGKLPISGKTLTLSTLSTGSNFATAYTNLNTLFDAVGDADLMRELKINSWVDNLPTAKLSYHRKEDVKRVFNTSFNDPHNPSSDKVISTFQKLFESGIYDLSSLEYFKDLLENQRKTEADIRAMIRANIFSLEDYNAYLNLNTANVQLKTNGDVDKTAQVNLWVTQGKISNDAQTKTTFERFLSDKPDSVLKTETYYIEIYDNLGPGGLALPTGTTKVQAIGAFADAHAKGAKPRELMDLVEYSLAEGLSYADINTPIATGDKSILEYLTSPMDSSNMHGYNIKPQFARRHELLREALVSQSFPRVSGFTYNNTRTDFENLKLLLNSVT